MALTVLRSTDQIFCRISLDLGLPGVFSRGLTVVVSLGEGDHRNEGSLSLHLAEAAHCQHDIIADVHPEYMA